MPWPTYSERLFHGGGPRGVYLTDVLEDKRVVLKSGSFACNDLPADITVYAHGILVYLHVFQVAYSAQQWNGMLTLYEREQLKVVTNHPGVYWYLSGFGFNQPGEREKVMTDITFTPTDLTKPARAPTSPVVEA